MSGRYRLLFSELVGGELLGEIRFADLSIGDVLNGAGQFTATVPLRQPGITQDNLAPARTGLYVERDGVILSSGAVLWAATADPEAGTLSLAGEGLWSYYSHRTIRLSPVYAATEQTSIVADIIADTEATLSSGIGVTAIPLATGVLRDRTYVAAERKPVSEAVEELAAVQNGFDFYLDSRWDAGTIKTVLNFQYPATGRETEHVVERGRTALALTVTVDGAQAANVVDAFGAGQGTHQLIRTQTNTAMIGPYPYLEAQISHTDVTNHTTLIAHADRRLLRGGAPIRQATAELDTRTIPPGSFRVGDRMRLRVEDGWLDIDDHFRVVSSQLQVAEGREQLTVQLAGLEAFLEV